MSVNKFIYVFSADARDKLLSRNFKLLKSDQRNNIFIFSTDIANDNKQIFAIEEIGEYIISDTLTF